jgi:hypothetical protein
MYPAMQRRSVRSRRNYDNPFALAAVALCMSFPSFAGDFVGHSVKAVGKDTYTAANDADKLGKAVVKLLF